MVLPSGSVPCNSQIRQMIKVVKPYIWQLVEDANLVSLSLNQRPADHCVIILCWFALFVFSLKCGFPSSYPK